MIILAKYATADTMIFPVLKAGTADFAVAGDWTPATGDVKGSLDGGNVANLTNLPAAVGGSGSALWSLALTTGELTGAQLTIQIVDAATKAINDQAIMIRTFGHASAYYPFNFDQSFLTLFQTGMNTALAESYAVKGAIASPTQLLYLIQAMLAEWSKSGTTMTAKKLDGTTPAATFTLDDATQPTAITRAT